MFLGCSSQDSANTDGQGPTTGSKPVVFVPISPYQFIFEKIAGSYTSGRFALWKNALERYEKNRFFGYGPQADRIMLFDPTDFDSGNNVSNTMIYGLLSGGYFSLTILILIYIYV